MRDFRLAKATKPSQLSSSAEGTLALLYEMNSLLSSIGIREHFIDAEWASTDPRFSDLSILLEEQKDVTLVVTISVRRSDADMRVKEFIEMAQSYSNLQPCLVPGNPAYLSQQELCKNSIKLIEEYARRIRRTYDGTMYLGCEKIEKASARIARLLNMRLFHVYRRSKLEYFLSLADEGFTAIYTPVILDSPNAAAKSYVARRLGANNPDGGFMGQSINEYVLSLTGDGTDILEYLRRRCVTLVIQPFSNSASEVQEAFRKIRARVDQ
ncbi:MAG: hypothetical protein LZ159_04110 [Thaumarchaeota archaeon]|nr:hypothetical protein [Candidatus Terraquivivens yellowstonensis]